MNIELNSEPDYRKIDKYIKTKIKMYENKVYTHFQSKEVPKENALYDFLSLINMY